MPRSFSIVGPLLAISFTIIFIVTALTIINETEFNDGKLSKVFSNLYTIRHAFTFSDIQRKLYIPLCTANDYRPSELCQTVDTQKEEILKTTMRCETGSYSSGALVVDAASSTCACIGALIDAKWLEQGPMTSKADKVMNSEKRRETDDHARACIQDHYIHRVAERYGVAVTPLYILFALFIVAATAQIGYRPTELNAEYVGWGRITSYLFRPYAIAITHVIFLALSLVAIYYNDESGRSVDLIIPLAHIAYLAYVWYVLGSFMWRMPGPPIPKNAETPQQSAAVLATKEWQNTFVYGGVLFAAPFLVFWVGLFLAQADIVHTTAAAQAVLTIALCALLHALARYEEAVIGRAVQPAVQQQTKEGSQQSNDDSMRGDTLYGEETFFMVASLVSLHVLYFALNATEVAKRYTEIQLSPIVLVFLAISFLGAYVDKWGESIMFGLFVGTLLFGLALQMLLIY